MRRSPELSVEIAILSHRSSRRSPHRRHSQRSKATAQAAWRLQEATLSEQLGCVDLGC